MAISTAAFCTLQVFRFNACAPLIRFRGAPLTSCIGSASNMRTQSQSISSSSSRRSDTSVDMGLASEYEKEVSDILEDYDERIKRRQALVGVITSTKNTKTITVEVERQKWNAKYNKAMPSHKKFMAHDEDETGNMGDLVRIVPCRPLSARKRHRLIDVIRKAKT